MCLTMMSEIFATSSRCLRFSPCYLNPTISEILTVWGLYIPTPDSVTFFTFVSFIFMAASSLRLALAFMVFLLLFFKIYAS